MKQGRQLPRPLTRPARRFGVESGGSVSMELVLTLPLLLWALAATAVFYDGYRARYQAEMAAQTVADIMSRETDLFTANYVEGLNDVFDFLADSRYPTRIRVSSVIWDSANQRDRLQWSYGTRGMQPLPEDTFELIAQNDLDTLLAEFGEDTSASFAGAWAQMPVADLPAHIPPILPGEALLLVETFSIWSPFANVGVGQIRFDPVVVVRPRFAPWINFEGVDPIYPETGYEVAWTGSGNDSLPDPGDNTDPPADTASQSYDFETGDTTGWSRTTIAQGSYTGAYLGPFANETWTDPVRLDVSLGADNRNATIEFDLLAFDTWDGFNPVYSAPQGDVLNILIDGTPVSWNPFQFRGVAPYANDRSSAVYLNGATYRVSAHLVAMGQPLGARPGNNDSVWHVTMSIENAPRSFALGFSAGINGTAGADESFGIDNLRIGASGTGTAASFVANPAALETAVDPQTHFPRYAGCPEPRIAAPWLSLTHDDLATGITMTREVGGSQSLRDCPNTGGLGYISASPQLVVNYDNQNVLDARSGMQITMNDGDNGYTCDSTLLIRDPNGQYWFNDDFSGWNAGLRIPNPVSGQYVIFLGRYGSGRCSSDLTINSF
ncbi:MAG: hypothetical protein H6899_01855 [Rhodobacter sp.]|nr:hypothetical protein [Paracoccaceae bacterium]MCB1408537.1 hypothetical protein [Paracoccaceae bacterium]MCC0078703.1 hypothetical protein [Rhodobacter sp.]